MNCAANARKTASCLSAGCSRGVGIFFVHEQTRSLLVFNERGAPHQRCNIIHPEPVCNSFPKSLRFFRKLFPRDRHPPARVGSNSNSTLPPVGERPANLSLRGGL